MSKTIRPGGVATILACAVGAVLAGVAARAEDPKYERRTISVSGTGKVAARPDVVEIQVGVVTQAESAKDAVAANNEAAGKLTRILKERGVDEKDVQTVQIQVMPQYAPPMGGNFGGGRRPGEFIPKIVGYRVENSVQIRAREIGKLGPLLDAMVEGGANQIRGIHFRVEQAERLLDKARTGAMEDARRKARLLAEGDDATVGGALRIEEHAGAIPPPRTFAGASMMAAPAPVMPVSAGEQELSVTVSVVFELLPGKHGAP